jgi:hypothetical protein
MSEPLQEYAHSGGLTLRVDRAGGLLRGVKLIGLESQNGRRYRPEALAAAVGLYEGAKVNVNHPHNGPLAPRDYRDRLGVVRQVEFRPAEGLFGNLHFNPKHALAEQLAWDAENNPRNVGFSHNVLARLAREGDVTVVEAITHVQSVDLVADPAATQGLFEERGAEGGAASRLVPEPESPNQALTDAKNANEDRLGDEPARLPGQAAAVAMSALTLESLLMHRPDLLETHARHATAPLERELQETKAREAALRARPRSSEQRAALGGGDGRPSSAREFAHSIRSVPLPLRGATSTGDPKSPERRR